MTIQEDIEELEQIQADLRAAGLWVGWLAATLFLITWKLAQKVGMK